jgi:outer membrane protein assembly factor BamB
MKAMAFLAALQAVLVTAAACSGPVDVIRGDDETQDPAPDDGVIDEWAVDDPVTPDIERDNGPDGPPDLLSDQPIGPGPSVAWVLRLEGGITFNASSMVETGPGRFVVAGWGGTADESRFDELWMAAVEDETVAWHKSLGGSGMDKASAVIPGAEGDFAVLGQSDSFYGGNTYTWVLWADGEGDIRQETAAGGGLCPVEAAFEDREGNLLIFGTHFGFSDTQACMMKLAPDGEVLIQRSAGGSQLDELVAAVELADGSIVAVGETNSFGAGSHDAWIVNLDSNLNVIWQKTLGGTGNDDAAAVAASDDGGILVAGTMQREPDTLIHDIMVTKLDPDGDVVFNKLISGAADSTADDVTAARDGGILVAGSAAMIASGPTAIAVLKLDAAGELVWQVGIGSGFYFLNVSAMECSDGGIAVLATQYTGDLPVSLGVLLAKLVEDGDPVGECSLRQVLAMTIRDSTVFPADCLAPVMEETSESFAPASSASDMPVQASRLCPE